MKQRILNWILDTAYAIDKKMGWVTEFEYETAPYCGHHHSGHEGRLTESHYHEGFGGMHMGGKYMMITRVAEPEEMVLHFPYFRKLKTVISSIRVSWYGHIIFVHWRDFNDKWNHRSFDAKNRRFL